MRKVSSADIERRVADLCIRVNLRLPQSVKRMIVAASGKETNRLARSYLEAVLENLRMAERQRLPICQDTGMVSVFVELGSGVEVELDGFATLADVLNSGIARGYAEGFLRRSVVTPLERSNTGSNTPAVVHCFPVAGERLRITVMAKGFGSENACALRMLNPADGVQGVEDFVVQTVSEKGANACPPLFLGIGIGGTFDKVALLSKRALAEIGQRKSRPALKRLEERILQKVNALNIGAGGFGGRNTALAVRIHTFPTHIAGLPVAVSVSCWAHRVGRVEL